VTAVRRVTTTEAAQLLNVPAERIRSWTSRRRVIPVGIMPRRGHGPGENLYLLTELEPLAAAYHRRRHADTPQPT
jgi:hypothetical protein